MARDASRETASAHLASGRARQARQAHRRVPAVRPRVRTELQEAREVFDPPARGGRARSAAARQERRDRLHGRATLILRP